MRTSSILRSTPSCICSFFFFNDTATTEIYTLSLHDALPIYRLRSDGERKIEPVLARQAPRKYPLVGRENWLDRSEEHTSELQSRQYLVCRLLLEKKKKHNHANVKCPATRCRAYSARAVLH